MAEKQKLTGPNFETGVPLSDLPESTPVLGYARLHVMTFSAVANA